MMIHKVMDMAAYREMRKVYYDVGQRQSEVLPILEARLHAAGTLLLGVPIGEHPAFLVYCDELIALMEAIHRLEKKVSQYSRRLPDVASEQFIRNALIEEIHQTNEVENVHSTRREIGETLDEVNQGKVGKRFDGMIRKYKMLLQRASIPLASCQDIRTLYDGFLADEVCKESPDNAPDGVFFRKGSVQVHDSRDRVIHRGVYPESEIITCMEKSLAFLHQQHYSLLIRVAAFHYLFGYIHPFYDGNGRMTRFISSYLLSQEFDLLICLRLSYVIKSNRNTYYRLFHELNDRHAYGDVTAFVIGFLGFVKTAAEQVVEYLSSTANRLEHYASILKPPLFTTEQSRLLFYLTQSALCGDEGFDIDTLLELMNLSRSTLLKLLKELRPFLRLSKAGKKNIYHIDLPAVDALEAPGDSPAPDAG